MKGDTPLATRLRQFIGVEGKVEQCTVPEFNTKANTKVFMLEKKEAPANALAEYQSTLLSSRWVWEHLEVIGRTGVVTLCD